MRTEFQEGLGDGMKDAIDTLPVLRPEDIAEAVVYVLSTGPHVQVF